MDWSWAWERRCPRLRRRHIALDRKTLRGPFFSQCYLTAPFALVSSTGTVLTRTAPPEVRPAAVAVVLAGVVWYLAVETLWFRRPLEIGSGTAFLVTLWTFSRAALYWILLGAALAMLLG